MMEYLKAIYKGEQLEVTSFEFTKGNVYRGFRDGRGLLFLQDDSNAKEYSSDCVLEKHENCYCILPEEEMAFEFID